MKKNKIKFSFIKFIISILEKKYNKKIYISFPVRILILGSLFITSLVICLICFNKSFNFNNETSINYEENGMINYKVYLKPNEFYEVEFLDKNMTYVASIIKKININFDYKFSISENIDYDLGYDIIANLNIIDPNDKSVIFEKEYILVENKKVEENNSKNIEIKQDINIDYDYYNKLANNFKNTYGLDSESSLDVYLNLNKNILKDDKALQVPQISQMDIKIPLSEKAVKIKINESNINNKSSIVNLSDISMFNVVFIVLFFIFFILLVCFLLEILELLAFLIPTTSNYDKELKKILTEYDRLIVETSTFVDFNDKNVVKVEKFSELLDARDNLKLPIMYHNVIQHHKSNFYIKLNKTIYLYVMKSADFDKGDKK